MCKEKPDQLQAGSLRAEMAPSSWFGSSLAGSFTAGLHTGLYK